MLRDSVKVEIEQQCRWFIDDDDLGTWGTTCGDELWCFADGDPAMNGMRYCPFCGRILTVDGSAD